jgi:DNA modification methylase
MKWGTGGLNIDGCRVETNGETPKGSGKGSRNSIFGQVANSKGNGGNVTPELGRFPANLILDEEAGRMLDEQQEGASRFFYCAKASKKERGEGNNHPTVKPIKLMEYLITLVTPPNGIILDPFFGSGTTGVAAVNLGFNYIGVELDEQYIEIARRRINAAREQFHKHMEVAK